MKRVEKRLLGSMRYSCAGKGMVTVAGFTMVALAIAGYFYLFRIKASAPYHYEMAKNQLMKGQIDLAVQGLEQAMKIDPQNQQVKELLSRIYLTKTKQSSNLADRVNLLQKASGLVTGEELLTIQTKLAWTYVTMAEAAEEAGRRVELLENALKVVPDRGELKLREKIKTIDADTSGSEQEKSELLELAQEIDPESDTPPVSASVSFTSAKTTFQSKSQPAKETAPPAAEKSVSVSEPPEKNDVQDTLEFSEIIESEPPVSGKENIQVEMSLDEIIEVEDVQERVPLLETYVREKNDAEACYRLAQDYAEMRIATLKRTLEFDSKHSQAKKMLSNFYFQRALRAKNPNEKVKLYNQTLEYDPGYIKALHNLGMILQKKGLFDKAIKKYETAIENDSSFAPSYLTLGLLYWKKKSDLEKAITCFEFYREIEPNSATSKKVAKYLVYLNKKVKASDR